jgi:hypothetical protein
MADRTTRTLFLTTLLLLGNLAAAHAEKLPEPTGVLKDYDGKGVVQISVPSRGEVTGKDGKKAIDPGFSTWFMFRQTYVNPNRLLMVMNPGGALVATLIQDSVERTYVPSAGYVIEKSYKNLEKAGESPIGTLQLAMSTYATLLRELDSGKILPPENFDALKEQDTKRLEALKALREQLAAGKNPDDEARAAAAAAEAARVRDDLDQLEIRKAHPCYLVEFMNKDLMQNLLAKGLVGDANVDLLSKGRTTFWVTKAEGLPVKIETTANDGSTAIFMLFKELRINSDIHPGEVVLGNPTGTRLFRTLVDLRDKDWNKKMEDDLNAQISRYELEKQRGSIPLKPVFKSGSAPEPLDQKPVFKPSKKK